MPGAPSRGGSAGTGLRAGACRANRIARFAAYAIRGAVEGLAVGVSALWALKDDVAARHPTHMEPPIVRPGHPKAQVIVVGIGPTDQDLPPPWQRVGAQADLLVLRR